MTPDRGPWRRTTGLGRFHAVEQFRSGDEWNPEASGRKQHAAIAGIVLHIMDTPLDCSDGNRIGHEIRLEAGLDDEQSGEALQHGYQSLSKRRANGSVPPIPA